MSLQMMKVCQKDNRYKLVKTHLKFQIRQKKKESQAKDNRYIRKNMLKLEKL